MKAKRREYTPEFRQEAFGLWERRNKSANEIEQELGIGHGLLHKCEKRYKKNAINSSESVTASVKELAAEIRRLKRQNAILQEERDCFGKCQDEQQVKRRLVKHPEKLWFKVSIEPLAASSSP